MIKKINKKHKLGICIILGIGLLLLETIFTPATKETAINKNPIVGPTQSIKETSTAINEMKVHFIDVGQGDAILIESNKHYMLIDAGENSKGTDVVNYLKDKGVNELDYVLGTHPHSDHIGGLDTIINSFTIGKLIMPDITHTTKTFEDVLDAIANRNLKITKAVVGNEYSIGSASFIIISPNDTTYSDLNNYSVGIKLTNGNNSFLLTGDAEELSEEEMMKNGIDLSADVLKLGHHGSSYSSSSNFLDVVNPTYAMICVGANNQYHHPNIEILQKMVDRNIQVFRTDKQGTVVFTSDGEHVTVSSDAYQVTNEDLTETTPTK